MDLLKLGIGAICTWILAVAIIGIGWVMNIIKLVSCDWIISGEEVLRIIGIFVAPIGGILGWIGHF